MKPSWQPIVEMTLVWWNTGLTPPAKRAKKRSDEDFQSVVDELKSIYSMRPFQILGLCEVSEQDLIEILDAMSLPFLKYHFHPHINNSVIVDTAVVYDERFLKLIKTEAWIDTYGRYETIKVGDSVTFFIELINEKLTVITSHWPSQLTYEEDHPHRVEMAIGHRKKLNDLRAESGESDPYMILMGDYNSEPFSNAMSKHLLATRDRGLVTRYHDMLYNPFWRHIGESLPHIPDFEVDSIGGTCFSSGDKYRRWANFDQIMFSGAFLRSSSIVLDESHTKILSTPSLKIAIESQTCIDHFPVTSTLLLRKRV